MIKEVSRRVISTEAEGMACGPISSYAVDAEIVVEDEGNIVFLHTEWVDAAGDDVILEATTESVYDWNIKIAELFPDGGDDFFDAIESRDTIRKDKDISKLFGEVDIYTRYADQYEELLDMMQEVLDDDGMSFDIRKLEDIEEEFI